MVWSSRASSCRSVFAGSLAARHASFTKHSSARLVACRMQARSEPRSMPLTPPNLHHRSDSPSRPQRDHQEVLIRPRMRHRVRDTGRWILKRSSLVCARTVSRPGIDPKQSMTLISHHPPLSKPAQRLHGDPIEPTKSPSLILISPRALYETSLSPKRVQNFNKWSVLMSSRAAMRHQQALKWST